MKYGLMYLRTVCHWKSGQNMLTSLSLLEKLMHAMYEGEKWKEIWEMTQAFPSEMYALMFKKRLYYFIASYFVLGTSMYFLHWTHTSISWEKHHYLYLQVRKYVYVTKK